MNNIKNIKGLNWKRFNLRASLFVSIVGAIAAEIMVFYDPIPPLEPIQYIPVWFYAWLMGALAGLANYWFFVGCVCLFIGVFRIIIWVFKGLKNE